MSPKKTSCMSDDDNNKNTVKEDDDNIMLGAIKILLRRSHSIPGLKMERKRQIVECVPNFSEGHDPKIIEGIADAIRGVSGVTLLDVDPGPSTNRTVYTFVGDPESVIEGALSAARAAFKLIDMRNHVGEHKRLGAMDVCPFIPVQGVEMEDCIYCARAFGERLSKELQVPVYLYGYASVHDHRKTVPQIRAGEYEGLKDKLQHRDWQPDFGPSEFVPSWGATIVGARKFLIAYNVNLISTKEQAHKIALNLREQGRGSDSPGRLRQVQAVGWYLREVNMAQVSFNLLDFDVTSLHTAFEEVIKDATELNLPVVGSQVVGLIPLKPMLMAADYYIKKEKLFVLEEDQKISLVVNRLGLSSISQFNPRERIIEYLIQDDDSLTHPLLNLSLKDFVYSVGDRTTAPGGGSVAAAVASLGAALGSMVAKLSYGKKSVEANDSLMRKLIPVFHDAFRKLNFFVDADTNAYKDYVSAMKLPKTTPEESAVREAEMEAGIKNAIHVPLELARNIDKLWEPCLELAKHLNITSASDLLVGVHCLLTGVKSAAYNVHTNLKDCPDEEFNRMTAEEIDELLKNADENCKQVVDVIQKRK